ncbi:type II CRISPR RNA-guided endonuclease Cas9 [Roseivirga pacifica]
MTNTILGLDLGTNSIGWALINIYNEQIIASGVRIFQDGVENLGEGENEISRNASRTVARSVRRQFFRRKLRKKLLLNTLAEHKLAPSNREGLQDWFRINPYQVRNDATKKKVSLMELGRSFYHIIQRRGFQSNSRKNSNIDGTIYKGDPKTGKPGILETQEQLNDKKTLGEYLAAIHPVHGEPYKLQSERIRNRYTTRQMYIEEFESIWSEQEKHHTELTHELKELLGGRRKEKEYQKDGILFYQRPLRSQKHLLGKCSFEPSKNKCATSHPIFEEFRVWQWVNTVEFNGRKLHYRDRTELVDLILKAKSNIRFSRARKVLDKEGANYQFNYKDDDTIKGSPTNAVLSHKNVFGEEWDSMSTDKKHSIWQALDFFEDKEKLEENLKTKWKLNPSQIEAINKYTLPTGYSSLSLKAIKNILPFLKKGFQYDQAVALGGVKNAFGKSWDNLSNETLELIETNVPEIIRAKQKGGYTAHLKAFLKTEFDLSETELKKLYHHSANIQKSKAIDRLPVSTKADIEIQSLKNPVVTTAIFELRKLVNTVIDNYGKPGSIKIEMARDLKSSKSQRQRVRLEQKANERFNDFIRREIEKLKLDINYDNTLRYKLWLECQKQCPYTGKQIALYSNSNDELGLFGGNKVVDIEHIHPWSRSINDSYQNKTLCDPDFNRAKGDKTPFEYIEGVFGEQEWEATKQRVLKLFKNRYTNEQYYPNSYRKFLHFVKKKHNDDFTSKHLNDTRYISKEAKNYLGKICDDITVASGQVTDKLRRFWGLNTILQDSGAKERTDHRHHAIDALTLAATEVRHIQEISKWNRLERNTPIIEFPRPWKSFRGDCIKAIDSILVSHKKDKKVLSKRIVKSEKNGSQYRNVSIGARGQLHKETVYGKRTDPLGKSGFHIRKKLDEISDSTQINKIVSPSIRKLILSHLENEFEIDVTQKFKVPKGAFFEQVEGKPIPKVFLPNKNGEPVPIKKVRIREQLGNAELLKENINQWVNPRNNHHVLLYEDNNRRLLEDVVTFWVAAERKRLGQPVYQLPENQNGKIVSTMHTNDMFLIGLPKDIDLDSVKAADISNYLYRVQKLSSNYYTFRHHLASTLNNTNEELSIRSAKKWTELSPVKVSIDNTGQLKVLK